MGQYRPSSLIPSTLTSTYTIDATVANDFRCKISGTSPTTKYRLKIMKNDITNASIYDTGVVSLSSPLYPIRYDGTQNELVVPVPSTSGMVNGDEYKWTMTSYWSDSDYYESYENVFKAYAKATLTITNLPTKITGRSYTFVATCTQAQGVGVERFGWIIRNADTKEEAVNTVDSGNIYSSDIRVSYNGFLAGTTEEIKVKVWLSDGTIVETAFATVPVEYEIVNAENVVLAKTQDDSGVFVSWNKLSYIYGTPENENYEFVEGQFDYNRKFLRLPAGNKVVYDYVTSQTMAFPASCSHTFSFFVDSTNTSIYRADGVDASGNAYYIEFSYDGASFYLDINGTKTKSFAKVVEQRWTTVTISPTSLRWIVEYVDSPLVPLMSLFPSIGLFPRVMTYKTVDGASAIDIDTSVTWNSISFSGKIDERYIWVKDFPLTDEEFSALKDINNVPTWDAETLMLATFDETFKAGNIESDKPPTEWIVYSIESGSTFLKPIKTMDSSNVSIVDYTARNNEGIVYYVFPVFTDIIGSPAVSNLVSPNWWSWDLIVCDTVDDDVYAQIATYKFDIDVSSGALSNNTKFNTLENFTKYAKVQNSNANYWTGTLTAYLGNCADKYSDTVEQMEEIKALTTDGKEKFLKDRKGNFWKVKLNSSVNETINDEYVEQAVTVNIGWVEVGDASNSVVTNIIA